MSEKIFHESWYRIAKQKISLRASIKVSRQFFRGRKWYVLTDPFTNHFYRLSPEAYEFVARLYINKDVGTVWEELVSKNPDNSLTQGDVIDLLAQLYHANLLHYKLAENSVKLFDRYKKKKQKLFQSSLLNILFFRMPLFDPDLLLKRLMPLIKLIFSPFGLFLWIGVVGFGIKLAIDNFSQLHEQSQGILAPSNLFLLYIGMALVKVIHEFGHSFAVRRFGGEVHVMGVMLLLLTPLPYMDATSAWAFRNRWKRVLVGASGILFELFIAGVAAVVWANTGEGLIHTLAYNMLFVASVSTLLFNVNPLLRFDGYYILSDLVNAPNLHQQSTEHIHYIIEKYCFGKKDGDSPAKSAHDAFFLSLFGTLSGMYKFVVFSGIFMFVSERSLLLALVMGISLVISWLIVPVTKLVKYLSSSPRLYRIRLRANIVTIGAILLLIAFLGAVPFPANFKSPGILEADPFLVVTNDTFGKVDSVFVNSGDTVEVGDTLFLMSNHELHNEISIVEAALRETSIKFRKAMQESRADLMPIKQQKGVYQHKKKLLYKNRDALTVVATIPGIWISPEGKSFVGRWVPRGTSLGQLVGLDNVLFKAVISQSEISRIFESAVKSSSAKVNGQADKDLQVSDYRVVPMEHTQLPSSALGWSGGGEIAVDMSDASGVTVLEPFYEVQAEIQTTEDVSTFHGHSGKLMFTLEKQPLLKQGWRKLIQLIQDRYHL